MQLEDYFDFLRPDDIRIKGHRIGIETVLYEYLFREKTPDEIRQLYSTLNLEEVYATILYYLHNKEKVDAYLKDWLEWSMRVRMEQERNPSPAVLKLRRLKAEREISPLVPGNSEARVIKYLLDENVADLFRTELVRREPGLIVWRIGMPGALTKGTLDPDILCWCEEFGFILVTNNRKSMPEHLATHLDARRHIPGILEMNPNMSVGETIEELLLIWAIADDNEYQDRIEYLPVS